MGLLFKYNSEIYPRCLREISETAPRLAIASLTDPAKLATFKREQAANS